MAAETKVARAAREWRAAAARVAQLAAAGPTMGAASDSKSLRDDPEARAAAEESLRRYQERKGGKNRR
jgi:hypothetical protein